MRAPFADRFVISCINLGIFKKSMFVYRDDGSVLLNEDGRKVFFSEWQKRKKEIITHPYLKEKMEWGMVPYYQAQLLARSIRSEIEYVPFFWK